MPNANDETCWRNAEVRLNNSTSRALRVAKGSRSPGSRRSSTSLGPRIRIVWTAETQPLAIDTRRRLSSAQQRLLGPREISGGAQGVSTSQIRIITTPDTTESIISQATRLCRRWRDASGAALLLPPCRVCGRTDDGRACRGGKRPNRPPPARPRSADALFDRSCPRLCKLQARTIVHMFYQHGGWSAVVCNDLC